MPQDRRYRFFIDRDVQGPIIAVVSMYWGYCLLSVALMLTIWGRINSINVMKVLWACAEMDIAYQRIDAGMQHGVVGSDEYGEMNPNRRVPTIRDGDFVLWESNAILQYAADKVGNDKVYPRDLRARADINRWMFWESASWFPSCYVYLVEIGRAHV